VIGGSDKSDKIGHFLPIVRQQFCMPPDSHLKETRGLEEGTWKKNMEMRIKILEGCTDYFCYN